MNTVLILFIPIVLAIILWVLCTYLDDRAGTANNSGTGILAGIFAGILTVYSMIVLIIWFSMALSTRGTVNDMVAFWESNQHNFVYAVQTTEDVNIVSSSSGIADVAYWEQGKVTGARIQEERDRANWYNRTLQNYLDKNSQWFLSIFYHDPPDSLKPIVLLKPAAPSP